MRKRLTIIIVTAAIAMSGLAWLLLSRAGDPIAAAKLRIARNDMRGASLYLRDAIRAHPKDPQAAFLLGKVDLALGNPVAAQTELMRARAEGYDKAAIILPLGQAYLQQRRDAELLQDFTPENAPSGAEAYTLSLRSAAQMALHDPDGARESSAKAEALAPQDPNVLLAASRLALVEGDVAGAQRRLTEILTGRQTPDEMTREDALLLEGDLDMRHADAAAALAKARAVLAANPGRLDAKLLEARGLAASGQEKAARVEVDEVLHHAPKDISANYLRVVLAIRASDYAAADSSLLQIDSSITSLPRGFYFMAVTKLGIGQLAQAEEAATQFLTQDPDDLSGLKLMAVIDLARHHPDRALALLQTSALATHQDADTLDLRGRALAMSGDLAGARESLTKATSLHPADPNILNRLAAVEMDLGHVLAGEADLKQSLAIDPRQGQAGAAIVEADIARGDLGAARQDLAQIGGTLGDTEAAGMLEAQIRLADLDTDGAEAALRAVKKRFPDSRAATLYLVRIASLRGDSAEAQTLLEAALKQHPADAALLGTLLPFLYAQNQMAHAVALAQAAHDAVPGDPTITAILADTFVHAGQADRAIGLLDRASAGTNPDLDEIRARLQARQGQTSQALSTLRTVLDRSPGDIRARGLLAAIQVKGGDYDGARATLRDGLKLTPGAPAMLQALVDIDLKQAGSPQAGLKAALATAAALRAVPANLPAAASLPGTLYLEAGNPRAAAAAFLAAYKAAPNSALAIDAATAAKRAGNAAQGMTLLESWTASHANDIPAQLVLSSFYLESDQLAAAAERLKIVIAADSTNAAALNNLAWIRQRQGNTAAAKSLAARAFFAAPGPETADTLGWILAQQGNTGAALALLKQAIASPDPKLHAAASYHHAVALAAAGQRDKAREELQSDLATDVAFHERDDAARFLATLK